MMLLLMGNILANRLSRWSAHGKRGLAILPRKKLIANLLMHPHRRRLLQLPHDVRQAMRGLEPDEQMHMIRHAAHFVRKPVQPASRSAQIFMQPRTPRRGN